MGNAGSAQGGAVIRDRHKSGEVIPSSPSKEGQAFIFDKVPRSDNKSIVHQGSQEDEPPAIFTTPNRDIHLDNADRPRANTIDTTQTNSYKTPTVFRWEGGGKEVFVSGSFSEWKTIPMVKSHGNFVTIVDLPEGEHQYKFYVDGEWRNDPGNQVVENTVGTKNNQISVRKSDFEVFQALDKDSESCPHDVQREYSQEIPSNKPWEKQNGPPILPPHLLQVILNKDTPLSCEPTLLPEPNHVMLNHLYALSIKDGVMVLSATHRYRKKYVTTLLYKPITT